MRFTFRPPVTPPLSESSAKELPGGIRNSYKGAAGTIDGGYYRMDYGVPLGVLEGILNRGITLPMPLSILSPAHTGAVRGCTWLRPEGLRDYATC